jgi:hypothetical protein
MWRAMLVTSAFAALVGCAPVYSDSASDFAKGVSDVKDASTTLSQNYTGTRVLFSSVRRRIDKDPPIVPDACATTSLYSDCYIGSKKEQGREQKTYQQVSALVAVSGTLSDAGGPKTKEVNPAGIPQACIDYATNGGAQEAGLTTAEPNATVKAVTESDILAALDNYAKGLAAITDKADSDAYKAAASKLSSSIGSLAGTVGAAAGGVGAAVGPVLKAVIDIGTHINLARLENDRYQALKVAVLAACIPVHNLAYAEATILSAKRSITADENRLILNDLSTPATYFQDPQQNEAAMNQASANLRSIGPDPSPTAIKIAQVHNQLLEAILSGKGQTDALIANVAAFATEAQALKSAIQVQKGSASSGSSAGSS